MSRLGINTGSNPNDGQGDPLRIAMGKINSNFTEIYDTLGDGNDIISYASTAGISTLARNLTGSPRINVSGILNTGITTTEHLEVRNITSTGIITAVQFIGDGSQLENVVATSSGVEVLDENVRKGVAKELNFGTGLFCSGPDGIGRVTIAVTTSIVSGGGTGGSSLELRNQNVILGEYYKLNFGSNLLAYVDPSVGVVTVTTASGLNVSGVITATSFRGSGSSLTGVITSLTGYATTAYVNSVVSGLSTFSGSYDDLSNKPTIPSIVGLASEGYVDVLVSGIATFSGNYDDLTNKPTIPVNLTDLSDVNAGAPSTGQVLKWSGSEWQASADLTTSGLGIGLSDLSVTISSPGINSLTYNNTTGVFQFTPSAFVSYASSSGISTISEGLTGTPDISVNEVGISSYLTVTGVSTFLNNVHIEDAKALIIGDNDELQLFHSGVDSYIDNSSAGNLIIRDGGLGIQLRRSGGGPGAGLMAAFNNDAGVELYYDSVLKLQTFENGVAINDSVGIGTTAGNPPYRLTVSGVGATITSGLENAIADLTSSVDGYGQVNIRNSRSAPSASGDLVITADTGTDTSNYIDLGINNTGFSTSSWTINGVLDGYLYTSDSNLSLGVAAAGKYLSLFAGGTLAENEKVRVTETGVGIGSTQPTSMFAVGGDVRVSGVITATAFYGSGSNLSGILTSGALSGYATTELLDSVVSSIPTFDQDLSTTNDVTFNRLGISAGEINVGFNSDLLINMDGPEGSSTYTFTNSGTLSVPGNIEIDVAGVAGYVLFNNNGSKIQAEPTNDFEIHVGGFANKVTGFGTDGSLSVPENVVAGIGNVGFGGTSLSLSANYELIIQTDISGQGEGGPIWRFSTDGQLSLPNYAEIVSATNDNAGLRLYDTESNNRAQLAAIGDINLRTDSANAGVEWILGTDGTLNNPGDVIVSSGNIGIGTTIAGSALWVEGDGRFSGVVTATRFESTSAGTPTIDSPNNLNINAVTVAISTDLTVGGDAYVGVDTSSGLILTSPNGTQYRLVVDNSGNLSTVLVP
jgi:hypothetical protein